MDRDPRVDAYVAAASEPVRPLLEHLRAAVRRILPQAQETMKWNVPHYVVAGKNIAGLSGFKAHCAFGTHGDPQTRRYIKIASFADMPSEPELAAMLHETVDRIVG